ncbi:hypothetical protein SETIT_3G188300v2 [Setaria italica]|uniref:Uncharacterized protein n=1 Tax=Setaria italica TaxID=4555 RepID=K3ZE58_SETIT|nr:uncharacterized protein LOC111256610 isoform X2 [Setaria italica]RCV17054.1 hypothetical protein SETIT_3G188300v2 [Setaria italica]
MATKPCFLWGDTHASSAAASDPDLAAVFGSGAPETALLAAAATAAGDAAAVSQELGAAAVARPRLRRNSSGSGKQPQQQAGGGARKPPQRGLGVAELERLRCGGDPLRELSAVVVDAAAGAQGHPLLHYHPHHHLQMPPSAFEAASGGARYCSQLLAPAPPTPPGAVCFLHPPAAAGCQRAPLVAPEQQYFRDRWGRMGGFSPAGNGSGGGADHQPLLLPAPEHPSSQNTIWRPAVPSSSSSCLQTGHRCDFCCRRMRALAERGALAPTPPASPNTGANTNTMSDYSIYDLAAAMATARQGDAFLALERKGGAAAAEAPAKKEVREIEFFPAASAHHACGGGRVSSAHDVSELAAPFSSPYGAAAGRTPPKLDLSLRL